MSRMLSASALLLVMLIGAASDSSVTAASKPRVLVVISSATELELQDGRRYATGYFLNELAVPVQALVQAGYEPVFASPLGTPANRDSHSEAPVFFGGDLAKMEAALRFVDGLDGLRHPRTLASVRAQGVAEFDGFWCRAAMPPCRICSPITTWAPY